VLSSPTTACPFGKLRAGYPWQLLPCFFKLPSFPVGAQVLAALLMGKYSRPFFYYRIATEGRIDSFYIIDVMRTLL